MAFWVGAGILLSRITGLLRERALAYYFGSSDAGDAFKAALRIPNLMQNLLGEGVLSASFIPEYVKSRSSSPDEARRLAWALLWILSFVTTVLCLAGYFAAPYLVYILTPGFTGEKQSLTIDLVRILFPGVGLLVLSAWCLGVLNSHRRFFLSYAAPVIWNITIILFLVFSRYLPTHGYLGAPQSDLAFNTALGLVMGSLLQVLVQWPATWKLLKPIHWSIDRSLSLFRVAHQFWPAVLSRGVVQISSYFDNFLASFLISGSVSILSFAQTIYLLPISLFGMSVSAAELPEMSESSSVTYLRGRIFQASQKLLFYTVPSSIFLFLFASETIGLLFQTGAFSITTRMQTAWVLMFYAIGVIASTQSRLWVSALYACQRSADALFVSLGRVSVSMILSWTIAQRLSLYYAEAIPPAAGIALGSAIAAWLELWLLQKKIPLKFRATRILRHQFLNLILAIGVPSLCVKALFLVWPLDIRIQAMIAILITGSGYLAITAGPLRHPHARAVIARLRRITG